MKKLSVSKNRIVYMDVLRIIACFFVALGHVSAQHVFDAPADSSFYKIHIAYNFIAFSGVSIYIMISGALMLSKEKEVSIKKTLLRFLNFYAIYFIWKFIFFIYSGLRRADVIDAAYIKQILISLVKERGHYHLWYLPTIAIIYLFIPIIKKSLEDNKKACELYLVIFFIMSILLETLDNFEFKYKDIILGFRQYNDFYLFTGYIGYFILGHYIHKYGDSIKKWVRVVIYVLAIATIPVTALLDSYISIRDGQLGNALNNPFSLPSFILTIGIFLFIKNMNMKMNSTIQSVLGTAAALTFGIYLLHPMIVDLAEAIGFSSIKFNPIVSVPVIAMAVVVVTAVPVFVIYNIPVVKRLIT